MQYPKSQFNWQITVRLNEVDVLGVVNHAHYLHYFEEARVQALLLRGINVCEWHEKGLDFVVIHADVEFKASLYAYQQFTVHTNIEKAGKLRLISTQKIIRNCDNVLIAQAKFTAVCLSKERGKPVFVDELNVLFDDDEEILTN